MQFEFLSYKFLPSQCKADFYYATDLGNGQKISWQETINLPSVPDTQHIPAALLEKTLQSLHLMLGISYYKYHFAGEFNVPYQLTEGEAEFFNTVYKKGLGEFMYRNNLDPNNVAVFEGNKSPDPSPQTLAPSSKFLVALGGGKDSIVAAELLKQAKKDITAFVVETGKEYPIVNTIIATLGAPAVKIGRTLDQKAYQKHTYNGHIPISAIYAFLGYFTAMLYGYGYVVVGNEQSSNFGNLTYKGLEINHQWSKSFEFESAFNKYAATSLAPQITYFSLLRSLYEIRIVKLFAKLGKKYFRQFSSCNRNFSSAGLPAQAGNNGTLWCGQCAKCVFAFTLLSAYLPKKNLVSIFGQNLYDRQDLLPLFKDIMGLGTMKPFDCVGTFEEAQTALAMAAKKFKNSFIMRQMASQTKADPEVFQTAKDTLIPDHLKFLGMETVAIVRSEGKEGTATKKFLKKYYPTLTIVAGNADITIKTPGVNKNQMMGFYTTPTNLFFGARKGSNTIIGVTGSKGKSTTSTLIYHILKAAGKDARLLGNIGKPMIEDLLKPVPKGRIFVLEISSFQLDDIHYSPNIAVVTNLFPEHMDFHGSLEDYYAAKKNIFAFQTDTDHLVFCPKATQSYETTLLGEHNQNNIEAAAQVARILQIPEETIKKAVKEFTGLPHRLEKVGEYNGITFYDDAISTTPESTLEALAALPNTATIFLGGQDRGYNFVQLEKALTQSKVKNIVLFPDSGDHMLKNPAPFNILRTHNMKEAVAFAYQYTPAGNVCLLSCASPSYSLWKNFEVKGDEFKKAVKTLAKKYKK